MESLAGFYSSPSSPSKQSNSSSMQNEKKLTPVNIRQCLEAKELDSNTFELSNTYLSDISLVALVTQISPPESTNRKNVQLKDSTGEISAFTYSQLDPSLVKVDNYYMIVGKLTVFAGSRHIQFTSIKPLEDKNLITAHILRVIHVHLSSTKPKPVSNQPASTSGNGPDQNTNQFTDFRDLQSHLCFIVNNHGGLSQDELIRQAGTSAPLNVLNEAISGLLKEGYLTTGSDQKLHFQDIGSA